MIQPFNSRRIARNRIALALAVLLASVLAITALSVGAAASTTTEQIAEEELEIEEGEHIETELAFADNATVEITVTDLDAEEPEVTNETTVVDDNTNVTESFDVPSAGNYSVTVDGVDGAFEDVDISVTAASDGIFGMPSGDGDSWLSTPLGLLSTIGAGVAGYLAVAKGYAGAAVSRVSSVFSR